VPKIELTDRFSQLYNELPEAVRKKVNKAIRLLAEDIWHPSLQSKPIQGAPGIYEARVDRNYRITYERLAGDILLLRVVAKHDDALKNP